MIKILYGRRSVCMGDDVNNGEYLIKMPDNTILGDFVRVLYKGGYGNEWPIPLSSGVNWTVTSNIGDIATIFGMHEKITYHIGNESTLLCILNISSVYCESKAAKIDEPITKPTSTERWGMPVIEQNGMAIVEDKVEAIREKALSILKKTKPDLEYVVDPYILDDYYSGQIDKPGTVYPHFRLPGGKNEDDIVDEIVCNTLKYFSKEL